MTNDEIPKDVRSTNDEIRSGQHRAVSRDIGFFLNSVIRASSFLRHWVLRHSSFLKVISHEG